jgi:hypothetical protein
MASDDLIDTMNHQKLGAYGNHLEGGRSMSSTRAVWLRTLRAGLVIAAAQAGAASAWAQGFGPDPFQPYNNQYEPYVYPLGPANPAAGQSAGANMRSGVRGSNDWENYMNSLAGAGRAESERFGIGMPYYRSAVDSRFDKDRRREYRPNRKADQAFERTQELIAEKYLAYFSERDPARRAALLRDFSLTRRRVTRALSAAGGDQTRLLDEVAPPSDDRRGKTTATARDDESRSSNDRAPRASDLDRSVSVGRRSRSIPAAPLPPGAAARPRRTPEEVIERARRVGGSDTGRPGNGSRSDPDRPARKRSIPPPPPLSD